MGHSFDQTLITEGRTINDTLQNKPKLQGEEAFLASTQRKLEELEGEIANLQIDKIAIKQEEEIRQMLADNHENIYQGGHEAAPVFEYKLEQHEITNLRKLAMEAWETQKEADLPSETVGQYPPSRGFEKEDLIAINQNFPLSTSSPHWADQIPTFLPYLEKLITRKPISDFKQKKTRYDQTHKQAGVFLGKEAESLLEIISQNPQTYPNSKSALETLIQFYAQENAPYNNNPMDILINHINQENELLAQVLHLIARWLSIVQPLKTQPGERP